jgi:hypothetical protein
MRAVPVVIVQPVLVPRSQKERATLPDVVAAIKSKATASHPRFPPVLIFPCDETLLCRLCMGPTVPIAHNLCVPLAAVASERELASTIAS